MKKIYFYVLVILFLFVTCQTKKDYPLGIKAFRADIGTIRTWIKNYTEAINTADIERLLSYESDDIFYMPPNQPYFSGKENLRKWYLSYFNYFTPSERLDLVDFEAFGDFAYLLGKYHISGTIKQSGEEFRDNGKCVNFFKRQPDGTWICTHSIWNSDSQTFDIHSQTPSDFSGKWELDMPKSTPLPNIVSSTLIVTQKGIDITIKRTYEIKDREPLISTFKYSIGSETNIKTETGTLKTTSFWSTDKQAFTIVETLMSEKNGSKKEYKRTTVYSLTAKGEVLNIISDDILPEGSLTPENERHTEMIYTK